MLAKLGEIGRHDAPVKIVESSRDGALVASADTDRRLKVWRGSQELYSLNLRAWHERFRALDRIRALKLSDNSQTIYVASGETVKAIQTGTGEIIWEHGRLPTWAFLITCPQTLAIGADRIAVGYDDGAIEVVKNGSWHTWHDNDAPKAAAFLPGDRLLAGTDLVSVCIWDTDAQTKVAKFRPKHKVHALAASPVADVVATRSLREVEIWDAGSCRLLGKADAPPGLPYLAFHPEHEWLASTDAKGVSVFDFSGELVRRLDTGCPPKSLAWTRDGLLIGRLDGVIVSTN